MSSEHSIFGCLVTTYEKTLDRQHRLELQAVSKRFLLLGILFADLTGLTINHTNCGSESL